MNSEQSWGRITEDVQVLAEKHNVNVPEALLRVSGNYWERNAQRRAALKEFLAQIPGMPEFADEQSADEIANVLDGHALQENADAGKANRRRKVTAAEEAPDGPAV